MLAFKFCTVSLLGSSVGFVLPTTRGLSCPLDADLSPGVSNVVEGAILRCVLSEKLEARVREVSFEEAIRNLLILVDLTCMETRDGLATEYLKALVEILGGRWAFSVMMVAWATCESLPLAEVAAGTVAPIKFDVVVKARASSIVDMLGGSSTAIIRRLKSACPRRNIGGRFRRFASQLEIVRVAQVTTVLAGISQLLDRRLVPPRPELTVRCSICNSTYTCNTLENPTGAYTNDVLRMVIGYHARFHLLPTARST
jgi:hypothetical protein